MKNKIYLTQEGKEELEERFQETENLYFAEILREILENSEIINPKNTLGTKELALEWFSNLPLEIKQNKMYHYCIGHDKGAFEFTEDDIMDIYLSEIYKPTLKELCKNEGLRKEVIDFLRKYKNYFYLHRNVQVLENEFDNFIKQNI